MKHRKEYLVSSPLPAGTSASYATLRKIARTQSSGDWRNLKIMKKILDDSLFKMGSMMFLASLVTGVFNTVYHLFMTRQLGVNTYGEFATLFGFAFFLFSILKRTIKISITNFISKFKGKEELDAIPRFHSRMLKRTITLGIVSTIIYSLLSGFIADFLNIESISIVLPLGIVLFVSCLFPVNLAVMQGLQKFKRLALTNIVLAGIKLTLGVLFVFIGFGIYGALGGIIAGWSAALLLSFYFIKDNIHLPWSRSDSLSKITRTQDDSDTMSEKRTFSDFNLKSVYQFSFPVLLSIAFLAVPTNVDMFIVGSIFKDDTQTGLYAAAALFGKIIYFLPVGIGTVMFPKIVESYTKGRDTRLLLIKSLLFTGALTGTAAISFSIFPKLFLFALGKGYMDAEPLLRYYGPLMFFSSLTAIMVYYSLGIKRYRNIYIFASMTLVELILIFFFHSTLIEVVEVILVINMMMFGLMCIGVFNPPKKNLSLDGIEGK